MKWMFLLILLLPVSVIGQNIVVVNVSEALIKAKASEESRTIRKVTKGTELKVSGSISGWFILEAGGFISADDVTEKLDFVKPTINAALDKELISKNAADYTEKELLYLLLQEQKKSDDLKSDVRTIKNIQVVFAVLSVVTLVVSVLQLSKL